MTAGRILAIIGWAGVAALGAPAASAAQEQPVYKPFTVPEAPAFTYLGVAPTADKPTTPRKLAFAVANAFDTTGRLKQGIAITIAPVQLMPPSMARSFGYTLSDYQSHAWARWLVNTTLSLATAKSQGDTSRTDLALGFRTVLFDDNDLLARPDYTALLRRVQQPCTDKAATEIFKLARDRRRDSLASGGLTPEQQADYAKTRTVIDTELKRCAEKSVDTLSYEKWNASGASIGLATGNSLAGSALSDRKYAGWAGWLTMARQAGGNGMFLLEARYDDKRPAPTYTRTTVATATGRLLLGPSPAMHYFVQLDLRREHNTKTAKDVNPSQWSGGVEFLASDQLWVSTGFGNTFATKDAPQRVLMFASLKWRVFKDPQIIPQ